MWYWLMDSGHNEEGWISHAIPEELFDSICESLSARGMKTYNFELLDSLYFDLPGMIMATREHCKITVGGREIEMPCSDWEDIHSRLERLKLRTDASKPYYKLHGFYRCICLTPKLRDEMLREMQALMQECNAVREYENRKWNEIMEQLDRVAVADGVEDISNALSRAEAKGKDPLVVVARRPTKKNLGDA